MYLPFFISKRYLFSKKSRNAINVISGVSVLLVTIATAALIIIFSVFNGFDSLVKSMLNSYDPDLKITSVKGKVFSIDNPDFEKLKKTAGVKVFSCILEDNVLLKSEDRQKIAILKGVDKNYSKITGIDSLIYVGNFDIGTGDKRNAVFGYIVAMYLGVSVNDIKPVSVWIPNRKYKNSLNPLDAFNKTNLWVKGLVSVEQEFDSKYVITNINHAQRLTGRKSDKVSSVEIKLTENVDSEKIQSQLKQILGDDYIIKNRYEQHELMYKIMNSEKWAIFFILLFIIIIASFSIIGSLTMLIIEKEQDIITLKNIGARLKIIRNVFLLEGWLISVFGASLGLTMGGLISWLQQRYGLLEFPSSGNFIINSYPAELRFFDFGITFLSVIIVGFFIAYFPSRFVSKIYKKSV